MGGRSALFDGGAGVTLVEGGEDSFFIDQTAAGDEAVEGAPTGSIITLLSSVEGEAKYVVDREIARGGMGAILRSIDRDLHREVAMKVMLSGLTERQKIRFIEEAQVTAQLTHPNIVPVYDIGTDAEGQLFFTMKLVKGRSLGAVLDELRDHRRTAERRFPLQRLLGAFTKVCDAIAYAHSRGVVHRDLKPANIMLGDFGEVLVMDWGLAKVGATQESKADAGAATGPNTDAELEDMVESLRTQTAGALTLDGQVTGTPQYMSPEQAEGRIADIDERSDIYALGAILYEMLCLKSPVEGHTAYDLLLNVAEGRIKPPEKRIGPDRAVPADLSAVALQALALDPADRYQAVGALKQDVE